MCGAPGSKTAQLIEMLHATETSSMPGNYNTDDSNNTSNNVNNDCNNSVYGAFIIALPLL